MWMRRDCKDVVAEVTALKIRALGRRCDLTNPAEITAAVRDVLARWRHVDILINNAGVAYYGPTHKMTAEQWDWLLSINLHAPDSAHAGTLAGTDGPARSPHPERVQHRRAGGRRPIRGVSRQQVRPRGFQRSPPRGIRPQGHRRDGPLSGTGADQALSIRPDRPQRQTRPRTAPLDLHDGRPHRPKSHQSHPQKPPPGAC